MEKFHTENFFNLTEFAHRDLFDSSTYPWEALAHLEQFFASLPLGKIECEIPEGVHLVHPELITILERTNVEPGATIKGPCFIGRDCEVRQGAYLRGHLLTGDRCILGHCSEFKRAILLNDVCAAHFNYVGDTILGNRVNLGAGVKLANLRLDGATIKVHAQGKRIDTGLEKLGAILGDGCQIGCNAVTNPGTLLGQEVCCPPCLTLRGYVPSHSLITSHGEFRSCL